MVATGEVLAGRYRVGELLGRGGMAEVHRGEDLGSGDHVAVKLLRGVDADAARRLAAEQRVLSRLRHPGLVGLRDSGTYRGDPFLVLDLVDGCDLASLLRRGPLGAERSAKLLQPVAEGLAHAHAAGVVHRDVKPANILVDSTGRGRLADFGIARLAGATRYTATGKVIGTAVYLAPEQVRGESVGPAADVYALGLVILECATGVRAFPGAAVESAMARLTRSPGLPEWLPTWMRQLLEAMTAMQPEGRPTSAEVARALQRAGTESVSPPVAAFGPLVTEVMARAYVSAGAQDASATAVLAHTPLPTAVLPDSASPRRRMSGSRAAWLAALAAAVLVVAGALALVDRRSGNTVPVRTTPGATTVTSTTPLTTAVTTTTRPPARTTSTQSTTTTIAQRPSSKAPKAGKLKDTYSQWQSDD